MKVGIIGAGNIGTGVGRRLLAADHGVMVSFARTPEALAAAAASIGPGVRTGTPVEAARFGDVVLLATPWGAALDAVLAIGDALDGKVLWDATNPLRADMSGLTMGTDTSAGEAVAAAAPGAKVVKAIPPFAELLHSPSTRIAGRRPGVFVCGDDAEARRIVMALVADIGAEGVDAGPLDFARATEPLGLLLVRLAYGQGLGARIGAALLQENGDA